MSVITGQLGEPVALPWLGQPRFRCFGCSPHNPIGLGLALYRRPDGRIAGACTLSERYASYPGVVHGGVVSALADEVMGNAVAVLRHRLAYCTTLRTRMLAPVRTGRRYLTVATLLAAGPDGFRVEADVLDPDGVSYVMASGTYRPIPAAHARDLMGLDDTDYTAVADYFDHRIGPQ